MLAPSTRTLTTGPRLAEKRKLTFWLCGVVLLGFELDLSFQPLLALVVLQHPGQGPVAGFVVHALAGFQVRMAAELLRAHPRVARHLHRAHARLRPGDDVKRNVHQLLLRVWRQGIG